MTMHSHTLAASLIALMTAAPAIAQQGGNDQQSQSDAQTGTAEQAQNQSGSEQTMPEAATPEGHGLSDIPTNMAQGDTGSAQNRQGQQGRLVMLDVDGFSQTIYERGYRQGYLRGIAEARQNFAERREQARATAQGMRNQQNRMESAAGGQDQAAPAQGLRNQQNRMQSAAGGQGQALPQQQGQQQPGSQQTAQSGQQQSGQQQSPDSQWSQDRSAAGATDGERGTIIVLPPGVTPEMFVQGLIERNERSMQGG